jgi:hypothetical protein
VTVTNIIFWDMTVCSPMLVHRRLGGTSCLQPLWGFTAQYPRRWYSFLEIHIFDPNYRNYTWNLSISIIFNLGLYVDSFTPWYKFPHDLSCFVSRLHYESVLSICIGLYPCIEIRKQIIITCRREQLEWDGRVHTTHCNSEMLINTKPRLIDVGVISAVAVIIQVACVSLNWLATSSFLTCSWKFKRGAKWSAGPWCTV